MMGDACSRCGGHGKVNGRVCAYCNGTGGTLPAPRRPADRR